jgi:hypothetical protein
MTTISIGRFVLTIALAESGRKAGRRLAQRLHSWRMHHRSRTAPADIRTCREFGLTCSARNDLLHAVGFDPEQLWGMGEAPVPIPLLVRAPRRR